LSKIHFKISKKAGIAHHNETGEPAPAYSEINLPGTFVEDEEAFRNFAKATISNMLSIKEEYLEIITEEEFNAIEGSYDYGNKKDLEK